MIISNGFSCVIHMGAYTHEVILDNLTQCLTVCPESNAEILHKAPTYVKAPSKIWCQISCKDCPTALHKYENFVLRYVSDNNTFGIGKILKYKPHTIPQQPEPVNSDFYLKKMKEEHHIKLR